MERLQQFVSYVQERKAKATARAYQRGAERFERFCEETGVTSLVDQHPGLLDTYTSWMIAQDLSSTTIRLMMAGTRAYLEWRQRQGEVMAHFVTPDMPKIDQKEPFALDTKQLVQFWRACAMRPDPSRTMLILLPLCGLRSEEICTLPLNGGVEVHGAFNVLRVVGKGGKRRSVPLLPQGNKILGQYIHGWRVHTKKSNPYLFPGGAATGHYNTRSLRRALSAIRKEIDVEHEITPHVLRKTYLTFLERAGLTPFAIAKLAGHSSPKTTHESYIHHSVESLIGKLDGVTFPTPSNEQDDD